jgi:tetratricopeptide (TPR) repeat protein/tRNA A-37 threonylcarbamoyl transferase component Bud32
MTKPSTNAALDGLVARVVDEYEERVARGETPDPEEYAARHPEAADEIRGVLGMFGMAAAAAPARAAGPPDALGDFRILREVGRGGMAVVYEAEQISLRRRVALKVLPFAAVMDPRSQQRFRNEALAAAGLDHPHIVRVLAVGSDRGVHYIAMQLIEGRSLADLIAQRHSPAQAPVAGSVTEPVARQVTERVQPDARHYRRAAEWCAQAADALEHAHAQGIVHRDVKPGNLLVDGQGQVWVADFGLAQLASDPGLTATGDLLGTPRYMSPEQAQARHNLVDHRSDVYALGATLYELLTGKPAVPGDTREEVLRRVAVDAPIAPRGLNRSIPAELETITLKAMAKDPGERYAAAKELADDLRRWLAGEPVWAKRPTVRQRLARWVGRHPRTAAALTLVLLVGLLGGWAWDRHRVESESAARDAVRQARTLWDAGRYTEAHAQARLGFLHLPRFGDATLRQEVTELTEDLTLLAALERIQLEQGTSVRVDRSQFDKRPTLAGFQRAFLDYGVDVLAGDEKAVAAALSRRAIRAEAAAVLAQWSLVAEDRGERERFGRLAEAVDPGPNGWTRRTRRAAQARDLPALKQLAEEAIGQLAHGADATPATVLCELAQALRELSATEEAVRLLRAAQPTYPDNFWVNHELAYSLNHVKPARPAEALEYYRAALALRPQSPGAWLNVGGTLRNLRRLAEAEVFYRRAILLQPDYDMAHAGLALVRAEAANSLGITLAKQGRPREAEAAYLWAIKLLPTDAVLHNNLGILLSEGGRYPEAVSAFRRAIGLKPGYAEAYHGLGNAQVRLNRLPEAEAALRRAVELQPRYAAGHVSLGSVCLRQGRHREGEDASRKAIRLKPDDGMAHRNLGVALHLQGRHREAEDALQRAIKLRADDPDAHYNLGIILKAQKRHLEAVAACRQALQLNPNHAAALNNLALILHQQGEFAEAAMASQWALKLDPANANAASRLARALVKQGRMAEAAVAIRKLIQLRPNQPALHDELGKALQSSGRPKEAIAAYREAIRRLPGHTDAWVNLGVALFEVGELDQAIASFREAIRLKPDRSDAHSNLGVALAKRGDLAESAAACREAIRLQPASAEAHFNLGSTLRSMGRFAEALAAFRCSHELGSRSPQWKHPTAQVVQECERLVELDQLLPAVLAGKVKPADADEALSLADLCLKHKGKTVAAVRFFGEAFDSRPKLAEELDSHRYNAACAAALAGCGKGADAAELTEPERGRHRQQARAWLTAELTAWAERAGPDRSKVLRQWQTDPDLAGVRDQAALAKLPAAERAEWQKIWSGVADLLAKSKTTGAPERRPSGP